MRFSTSNWLGRGIISCLFFVLLWCFPNPTPAQSPTSTPQPEDGIAYFTEPTLSTVEGLFSEDDINALQQIFADGEATPEQILAAVQNRFSEEQIEVLNRLFKEYHAAIVGAVSLRKLQNLLADSKTQVVLSDEAGEIAQKIADAPVAIVPIAGSWRGTLSWLEPCDSIGPYPTDGGSLRVADTPPYLPGMRPASSQLYWYGWLSLTHYREESYTPDGQPELNSDYYIVAPDTIVLLQINHIFTAKREFCDMTTLSIFHPDSKRPIPPQIPPATEYDPLVLGVTTQTEKSPIEQFADFATRELQKLKQGLDALVKCKSGDSCTVTEEDIMRDDSGTTGGSGF